MTQSTPYHLLRHLLSQRRCLWTQIVQMMMRRRGADPHRLVPFEPTEPHHSILDANHISLHCKAVNQRNLKYLIGLQAEFQSSSTECFCPASALAKSKSCGTRIFRQALVWSLYPCAVLCATSLSKASSKTIMHPRFWRDNTRFLLWRNFE